MSRAHLKLILITAYLTSDYQVIWSRISSLGPSPALALYLFLFVLLAGALFLAASIRNTPVRALLGAILSIASALQQSIAWVADGSLTYDTFINMYNARGNIDEALAQHGAILWYVVPASLLLFVGFALRPGARRVPTLAAYGAPTVAFLLLGTMLYLRGGEGTRALPAAYPPVIYTAFLAAEAFADPGPRRPVTLTRLRPVAKQDVLLIVDESIAANYLDIDNPGGVETGLKITPPNISITNYGYAASVHNCSATSNVTLRFGGTRDDYQDTIAHGPSIWAYAKHAGLHTVYIDAQSTGGHLQNLMTPAERAEIDEFVQFDNVAPINRDMAIADTIAKYLKDGRPEFLYVNKLGAHFPVDDKYPQNLMRYQPALPRTHGGLISWTSNRAGFNGTRDEWVRYRNSYRNTLLWNVSTFFKRLFAEADFSQAVAIYTSDHGQDLHELGNPGNNTHCGVNRPLQQEGLVPLLVVERKGAPSRDWNPDLAANHNGMSAFRIFPTLLELMGYNIVAARPIYGPPLDDPAKDDFSFNMLFNTRLGKKPEWQHIDLKRVIVPPASDFGGRLATVNP